MAVPSFKEFFRPILDELAARSAPASRADVLAGIVTRFALTPEDLAARLPSGREPVYRNRYNWAPWYLARAGLVARTRSEVALTDDGRRFATSRRGPVTANERSSRG